MAAISLAKAVSVECPSLESYWSFYKITLSFLYIRYINVTFSVLLAPSSHPNTFKLTQSLCTCYTANLTHAACWPAWFCAKLFWSELEISSCKAAEREQQNSTPLTSNSGKWTSFCQRNVDSLIPTAWILGFIAKPKKKSKKEISLSWFIWIRGTAHPLSKEVSIL